jgi:multidrug efflux pump subunit AcrA (membrane-fusion protein)
MAASTLVENSGGSSTHATHAEGRVRTVSPVIDPKTGAVFVEVAVPTLPPNWVAGLHLQVSIVVEERVDVTNVPNEAIEKDKDEYFVFKIGDPDDFDDEETTPETEKSMPKTLLARFLASTSRGPSDDELSANRVTKVEIEPGITNGVKTEVKSGLDSSDQVVIRGQSSLRSGMKVKIVKVIKD